MGTFKGILRVSRFRFRVIGFRGQGLGFPKIWGMLLGGSHNKDYSILRSIFGSLILGNYLFNWKGS